MTPATANGCSVPSERGELGDSTPQLRRQRSEALRARYPFAVEMLTLYEALLDVECGMPDFMSGLSASAIAVHAAEQVMPHIVEATLAHGPQPLAAAVSERFAQGGLIDIAARWLADEELSPLDRYLARAATQPVLEALGGAPSIWPERPQDERHCPVCAGLPQLAYFDVTGEALVTGPRRLLCARCSNTWTAPRLTCVSCGEQTSPRLPVFGEKENFPHVRVDGCETCKRYLLTIDLLKDIRAVPVVDELAALPLDLYAQERGLTKIMPNVLGN
jgi:formate dehydrogenase maturation protein FdhE